MGAPGRDLGRLGGHFGRGGGKSFVSPLAAFTRRKVVFMYLYAKASKKHSHMQVSCESITRGELRKIAECKIHIVNSINCAVSYQHVHRVSMHHLTSQSDFPRSGCRRKASQGFHHRLPPRFRHTTLFCRSGTPKSQFY